MSGLLVSVAALSAAMAVSELVIAGSKVQTRLAQILFVYLVMGLAALAYLTSVYQWGLLAFGCFWCGAFLTWFGIRSHVESSILLRLLYYLRGTPLTKTELLALYEAEYGEQERIRELERGRLVVLGNNGLQLTRKGQAIVRIARWLGS